LDARELIVSLCSERLPKSYNFSPVTDIQVLCPGRKGILGTNEINKALREILNPPAKHKDEITFGFMTFRTGDKVMQVKNNYSISWIREDTGEYGEGIFNGDIGIIEKIDKVTKKMQIRFDERIAVYEGDSASDLELSYACTVHKSQGSEYPIVIIPVSTSCPYMLLTRNLIYTAITRAEKMVLIVGDKETLFRMIENNTRVVRNTMLARLLKRD
jgi:exodeoxyribonuclease V alpha subunit